MRGGELGGGGRVCAEKRKRAEMKTMEEPTICGDSSGQGKNKAEANPLVLPLFFIQIFRKIRVLYLLIA